MYKIVTVNLGATSTKIAIFHDRQSVAEKTFNHTKEQLDAAPTHGQQLSMRAALVNQWLAALHISLQDISAAVVRMAGLTKCNKSGVYQIGPVLEKDIESNVDLNGTAGHMSLLGLHLLRAIAPQGNYPIYIVDSPWTDEYTPQARMTGLPDMHRSCIFHALNQKAVARKTAAAIGKDYWQSRIVVAHMGGGVSVAAHDCGRAVDTCCAGSDQDGPFSATRSGQLPLYPLIRLCMSEKYTEAQMKDLIMNKGGFYAHLGETDLRVIEQRAADGDEKADQVIRTFTYQMAKGIGTMCGVLGLDRVDAIALTGGMAHSERVVGEIRSHIGNFAPVFVYPGEEESEAMAAGALRALTGEEEVMYL